VTVTCPFVCMMFYHRYTVYHHKSIFVLVNSNKFSFVGFEVFTAVVMKSIIFWDMTPCSPLCSSRRFGGT
jgi:hypothetical protein